MSVSELKTFFLLFCTIYISSCSSSENPSQENLEPSLANPADFIDQGTSIYADNNPLNDVLLQGFWWDSYSDQRLNNFENLYDFLSQQLISLSNAHFDLIWFPPASEAEGMGYHPRELFDFNSKHGSKSQLETLLASIQERQMHAMADLVLNHRVGTYNWNDFTNPAWGCNSICIDDEGYTNPEAFGTPPCGDEDEGEAWGGARDLNHKSEEVQEGIKDYLNRLKDLGFDSWRYDFVKGFPAKYVGEYNHAVPYYLAVGEFWDGNAMILKQWIDQTQQTLSGISTAKTAAFDFSLKYLLQDAVVNSNYTVLNQGNILSDLAPYKTKAITFLDNHDTGCINRDDCDNLFSRNIADIEAGYAFLLTHPGIPMVWGYHYFFTDPSGELKTRIDELILIRKAHEIDAQSKVEIIEVKNGSNGYYLAQIDGKILIKIGMGSFSPEATWTAARSGTKYAIWVKQ